MISPLARARVLDAEMQLQRMWLEISLREIASPSTRGAGWSRLQPLKLGMWGLSMLKHRSMWLTAVSLFNLYRRRARKGESRAQD